MNDFVKVPSDEKKLYISQAALHTGLVEAVIEKDYWVCWILEKLFSLTEFSEHFIFKGGTSLSKGYDLIGRFSEDVDVSIGRELLGFKEDLEHYESLSATARERKLDLLAAAGADLVRGRILPALSEVVSQDLQEGWKLEIDSRDALTILFHFPAALDPNAFAYITPFVKIEFGVRGDAWPKEVRKITSFLAAALPKGSEERPAAVPTLTPERTFWEKATLLHAEYHRPRNKQSRERISRHYYDIFSLSRGDVGQKALQDTDLLHRVIRHKILFFRSSWANYDNITRKGLKLVPPSLRRSFMEADYEKMREMFFESPPKFELIVTELEGIERQIRGVVGL